jgi:hypothetical protein
MDVIHPPRRANRPPEIETPKLTASAMVSTAGLYTHDSLNSARHRHILQRRIS